MKVSFSSRNLRFLVISLLTLRIFTQMPMNFIKAAQFAAPLATLLGGAIMVFVIFLIARCISGYKGGNILDMAQSVFGTAGKIIVASLLALYLVLSAIFTLSDFSKLISLIAFPTSPMWYVSGFIILGGILGAMSNPPAVVRLYGFFAPVILIVFLLLLIFTILPVGNTDNSLNAPQNLSPTTSSLLSQFSLYGDIILLFLIAPSKESQQNMEKAIGYSALTALFLNTLFILAFTLEIPSSIAQNGQFPVYLLMKEVYFGRFFQRLDAVILLTSALSAMLYLSLNLNLLGEVLYQGFGLTQNRIVTAIMSILIFCLALNEWIFPDGSLTGLVHIFSLGGLAILIVIAILVKIRGIINEKN